MKEFILLMQKFLSVCKDIFLFIEGIEYKPSISFKAPCCLVFLFEPSKVNDLNEFVNMEKISHRYVIQYFHFKGLTPTNIKAQLDSTLGESAPSFTTVRY